MAKNHLLYVLAILVLVPALASAQTGDLGGLVPEDDAPGSVGEVGASYKFDGGLEAKILGLIDAGPQDGGYGVYDGTRYYDIIAVVSRAGEDGDEAAARNKASLVQKLELLGARNVHAAESLSFVTASIPVGEIPGFSLYEEVYAIGDGELAVLPATDRARDTIHAAHADLSSRIGHVPDGSGVTVAVIDLGIDNPHVNDRVAARATCDPDCRVSLAGPAPGSPASDTAVSGHGTRVAGVLAASGLGGNNGMAPGVTVLDVKHASSWTSVLNALDWAHAAGADVANLSLMSDVCNGGNATRHLLTNEAVDKGMVVVAAAGNEGLHPPDIGSMPVYSSVADAGCAHNAIAVGGIDDRDEKTVMYDFSGRGPVGDGSNRLAPHLVAPAKDMQVLGYAARNDTVPESGTSLAAPQASAVAAMMLQLRPELTPAEVRAGMLLGANWTGPVPCTSSQYEQDNATHGCSHSRQPHDRAIANDEDSLGMLNNAGMGILDAASALWYARPNSTNMASGHLDAGTPSKEYVLAADGARDPAKVVLTWMVHPHGGIAEQPGRSELPPVADLGFVIRDGSGNELASAHSANQTVEFAVFGLQSAGNYTLVVSGTGLDGLNKPVQNYALASTIPILPAGNKPPEAGPQEATVRPGAEHVILLGAFDPDGDSVSFSVSRDPSKGTVSTAEPVTKSSARVRYTADAGFAGNDMLEFTPHDGTVAGLPATVTLVAESLPPGASEPGTVEAAYESRWLFRADGPASAGIREFGGAPYPVSAMRLDSGGTEGAEAAFASGDSAYTAAITDDIRLIGFESPLGVSSATMSHAGMDGEAAALQGQVPVVMSVGYAPPSQCTAGVPCPFLPGSATYADLDVPIPDGTGAPASSAIKVPGDGRVYSLSVSVHIEHANAGDLRVVLESPAGNNATLRDWGAGGAGRIDAAYAMHTHSALGEMAMTGAAGDWTLHVEDRAKGGTGTVVGWGLEAFYVPDGHGPVPPKLYSVPADLDGVEANVHHGAVLSYDPPEALDAVGNPLDVACDPPPGGMFALGNTTVECSATDAWGATATAGFYVNVQDTTPPRITAPPDFVGSLTVPAHTDDSQLGTPKVEDIADPDPEITRVPSGPFPEGPTTVTWTATDASGNSATAVQRVTIVRTDATSIKAPLNITLEATAPLTPVPQSTLGEANVTGAGPSPYISYDPRGPFPVGTTEVVWTVSGTSGSASDVQLVTIQDTTPPSVTAPPDIVIESNLTSTIIPESRLGTTIAADLADPAPVVSHDSSGAFPQGTTTVTWTATDASGNTGSSVQTVTVLDPGAPLSITAPPGIKIRTYTHITPVHEDDLGTPEATGPDGFVISNDSPGAFHIGYTTVTWTVTDPLGRTANDTQRVYLRSVFTPDSDLTLREDFESGLGSWFENYRGNWEAAVPANQPPGYGGASTVARSYDCDYICTMTMTYPIDLSSFGPVALVFDRYMSRQLDPKEGLTIQMHDGTGWETVAKWAASDGHADSEWHREVIPIDPKYVASETAIRIIAHSSNPDEVVMVDNISIIQGAVSGDGSLWLKEDPGNASLHLEWDPVPGYETYLLQRNDYYGKYVPLLITGDTEVDLPLRVEDYDDWISLWLGAYNQNDPSRLVHVGTANTTTGSAPSELYSDLPMHSGFDSGLDGWWYKEILHPWTDLRCDDAASNPHGLSHSTEHGGSILMEDRRTCVSVSMGATRGFTVPLEHHGYDMHVSFEYRAMTAGNPTSDNHNNLIAYALNRNGGLMNGAQFRYEGNVTDTGWIHGSIFMPHASYANCPCSLYFFGHDVRSDRVERKIYLDNVHAELSPKVRGASDAPYSHNMLHEDEFLRMLLSHGSKVLVTQKVPYDSAVRLEWEPLGNATEYAVSIRPASDPGSMLSENVTGTQHMFVGLAPDTEYVVSVGVLGDGSTQSTLHARTWPAGTVPFDAGLELDAYFDGPVVSVSWTDSNRIGDNRYTLERSVSGGPYVQVYSGTGTSHSDFITPDMFAKNASYRVLEHVGAQNIYSETVDVDIP